MSKSDRYGFTEEKEETSPTLQEKVFPGAPPPPPVPFRKPQGGAILKEGQLTVGAFTMTDSGLQISGEVKEEDWSKVGELLFNIEGSIQWLIGDWLAYGISLNYGDMPRIADHFGRDESTLHTYKQMAENIEFTRRRVDLSFGHHQVVRSLTPEQQDYALTYAAENGIGGKPLSVSDFRKWIKQQQGNTPELQAGADQNPTASDSDKNYEILLGQFKHLRTMDPSKAKPLDREKARFASAEMQREVDEFNRRWGIE